MHALLRQPDRVPFHLRGFVRAVQRVLVFWKGDRKKKKKKNEGRKKKKEERRKKEEKQEERARTRTNAEQKEIYIYKLPINRFCGAILAIYYCSYLLS